LIGAQSEIVTCGVASLKQSRDPYRLETVARACDVLKCFRDNQTALKLKDIVERTGLNPTIAFRLVHTLAVAGILERGQNLAYSSCFSLRGTPQFRIGYAAQADEDSFSATVSAGIRLAAARQNIELIALDNSYSASLALKNAKKLAKSGVGLVLDFQTHSKIAPAVSAVFREIGIPLIAIEIPHPDAVFYGADNYRIGLLAGNVLAKWAKEQWKSRVQRVLLLKADAAGPLPQLRLSGAQVGIREVLPQLEENAFTFLETKWDFLQAFEAVRRYLRRVPQQTTLITGINDMTVLGALRAFEEAGRSQDCAAVSLGGIPDARAELRRKGTRLIASIAFFPERYGDDIIRLALDVLHKRNVPSAVYAPYQLVTISNLSRLYPMDSSS
jgi:ribose transport system substrate-binding protein